MLKLSKHQKKCLVAMSGGNTIRYYNNLEGGYRYYITNNRDIKISSATVSRLHKKEFIHQISHGIGGGHYILTVLSEVFLSELIN